MQHAAHTLEYSQWSTSNNGIARAAPLVCLGGSHEIKTNSEGLLRLFMEFSTPKITSYTVLIWMHTHCVQGTLSLYNDSGADLGFHQGCMVLL